MEEQTKRWKGGSDAQVSLKGRNDPAGEEPNCCKSVIRGPSAPCRKRVKGSVCLAVSVSSCASFSCFPCLYDFFPALYFWDYLLILAHHLWRDSFQFKMDFKACHHWQMAHLCLSWSGALRLLGWPLLLTEWINIKTADTSGRCTLWSRKKKEQVILVLLNSLHHLWERPHS